VTAARRPPLFTPLYLRTLTLQVSYSAALACFVLLPKFLATELAATPPQIGNLQAAFSLTNVLIVPLVGAGVDRLGRRAFLVGGSALLVISALGFAQIEQIGPATYALRVLQGASWACVYVAGATLVTDHSPPERLSQGLALFGACIHVTNGAVPLLTERAAEIWGWPAVFTAGACIALLTALLGLGVRSGAVPRDGMPVVGLQDVLRRRSLWRTIAVLAGVGVALSGLTTFIQPFAVERGITRVGGYFTAFSLSAVLVRVVLGGWIDRVDRHRVAAISALAYVVMLAAVSSALSAPRLVLFGAALGLGHGLFVPAFNAMNLQGVKPAERGKIIAVLSGSLNAGVGLATATLGQAAGIFGYAAIFPMAATLAAVTPLLLWLYRGADRWSAGGD
jgi:MFS family permease